MKYKTGESCNGDEDDDDVDDDDDSGGGVERRLCFVSCIHSLIHVSFHLLSQTVCFPFLPV